MMGFLNCVGSATKKLCRLRCFGVTVCLYVVAEIERSWNLQALPTALILQAKFFNHDVCEEGTLNGFHGFRFDVFENPSRYFQNLCVTFCVTFRVVE